MGGHSLVLSTDIDPSDPSLVDLTDDNDVPTSARIDDYGYGSDSDLEDCSDPTPVTNTEVPKSNSASKDNDELSAGVQGVAGNKKLGKQTAMRLRSFGSRHVLVKDTAFQTWYALLNYLYTGEFNFMPLGSTIPGGQPHESLISSLDEPRCSAKSMYRLASKVGLDHLRDKAFSYIRSNLTEHNILQELSCSLVSTHPQLLEMELDVLYSHIASPPIAAHFSDPARRIANKELVHEAQIAIRVHTRLLLKEPHPLPLESASSLRGVLGPPEPDKVDRNARNVPHAGGEDDGAVNATGEPRTQLGSSLWSRPPVPLRAVPERPAQPSAGAALPATPSSEEPAVSDVPHADAEDEDEVDGNASDVLYADEDEDEDEDGVAGNAGDVPYLDEDEYEVDGNTSDVPYADEDEYEVDRNTSDVPYADEDEDEADGNASDTPYADEDEYDVDGNASDVFYADEDED
ncbi:hypothetical protein HD554DRAFT_1691639 [Boletus coccyginus]|nr:hypothetical protein HD554DRAFT_1691639 [Boletus coccyginus]